MIVPSSHGIASRVDTNSSGTKSASAEKTSAIGSKTLFVVENFEHRATNVHHRILRKPLISRRPGALQSCPITLRAFEFITQHTPNRTRLLCFAPGALAVKLPAFSHSCPIYFQIVVKIARFNIRSWKFDADVQPLLSCYATDHISRPLAFSDFRLKALQNASTKPFLQLGGPPQTSAAPESPPERGPLSSAAATSEFEGSRSFSLRITHIDAVEVYFIEPKGSSTTKPPNVCPSQRPALLDREGGSSSPRARAPFPHGPPRRLTSSITAGSAPWPALSVSTSVSPPTMASYSTSRISASPS